MLEVGLVEGEQVLWAQLSAAPSSPTSFTSSPLYSEYAYNSRSSGYERGFLLLMQMSDDD